MYANTAMTLNDIRLRVALQLRTQTEAGDGTVINPTDPQAAQRLTMAVHDGIREFYDEGMWAWMRQVYTLTLDPDKDDPSNIAGDRSRFVLPAGVESIRGDGSWMSDGYFGGVVKRVHHDIVREERTRHPQARSSPRYMAARFTVIEQDNAGQYANEPRLELELWPIANRKYYISIPVISRPVLPKTDDARGNWPAVHDMTIVAYAARAYARYSRPPTDEIRLSTENEVVRRLALSRLRDSELKDASLNVPMRSNSDYGGHMVGTNDEGAVLYDGPSYSGGN